MTFHCVSVPVCTQSDYAPARAFFASTGEDVICELGFLSGFFRYHFTELRGKRNCSATKATKTSPPYGLPAAK
jgi:hypothetical protein